MAKMPKRHVLNRLVPLDSSTAVSNGWILPAQCALNPGYEYIRPLVQHPKKSNRKFRNIKSWQARPSCFLILLSCSLYLWVKGAPKGVEGANDFWTFFFWKSTIFPLKMSKNRWQFWKSPSLPKFNPAYALALGRARWESRKYMTRFVTYIYNCAYFQEFELRDVVEAMLNYCSPYPYDLIDGFFTCKI